MIRSFLGLRSVARLGSRALSTSFQEGTGVWENIGTASNNTGTALQDHQDVFRPEQFTASVFVPGDVGSLINLFAIIHETEKRFGRIAEFRCPTDPATGAPGARIFLRFASASSTIAIPDSRSIEKTRFLVPRPRPQNAPILPEGDSWADVLPLLEPYNGRVFNPPADRSRASTSGSDHLRAEISCNPNAPGANPRLNKVDSKKMRVVTEAMSGFSGFAPTKTLAVQQTQAAWMERAKVLDLKPYIPPPSYISLSFDTSLSGVEDASTSTSLEPATSESDESVGEEAEEDVELTPEEQHEIEQRQRQTYLASRFAPAPAPTLRELRKNTEPPKSKGALRRERRAQRNAAPAAPTSEIKTPAPTATPLQKSAKDLEAAKEKARKADMMRQMKSLITAANKLGKKGSMAQQIAFRAEIAKQARALEERSKALDSKIIQAKNRLARKEKAERKLLASVDEARHTTVESSEKLDTTQTRGGVKSGRSITSRILSIFGR